MAYDRYDTHRRDRDDGRYRSRDREPGRNDDDRGFFERAGDEISSWFGDDNSRRDERDHRDPRDFDREQRMRMDERQRAERRNSE
jgi:hypothetical protein